jgi:hypothetical protein
MFEKCSKTYHVWGQFGDGAVAEDVVVPPVVQIPPNRVPGFRVRKLEEASLQQRLKLAGVKTERKEKLI